MRAKWTLTPSGTDTITATASPTLTAYAAGQVFRFVAAGTNTGAVTLNIDSLGAKAVTKFGTTALIANDIMSGQEVTVVYDGTRFQMVAPARATSYVMSTAKLLGRTTASTGAVEEITVSGATFSGGTLTVGDFAGTATNLTIAASRAGSAETIALKTKAGSDPSASDPITIAFRNATVGTGDYTVLTITAATSLTISSGSTLGMTNSVPARLWLVGFNDGGTFRLGIVNSLTLWDDQVYSSTAEGGAGGADSAGVIYTGTGVTSKACRVLGYLDYTLSTVGTWDTAPTKIQIFGPNIPANNIGITVTVASTSGTSIDFTGIPVGVKRVTMNLSGVSTNGTSALLCQIGDSGGIETSGYTSAVSRTTATGSSSAGFLLADTNTAALTSDGSIIVTMQSAQSHTWSAISNISFSTSSCASGAGSKALSNGPLDRIRLTTVGGTDSFDAGTVNITWE